MQRIEPQGAHIARWLGLGGRLAAALSMLACAPPKTVLGEAGTSTSDPVTTSPETSEVDTVEPTLTGTGDDTSVDPTCGVDLPCVTNKVDLLFVIDNSGTMAEEPLNLARNFPALIEALQALEDGNGQLVGADVQIMVTTTDFGNPACDPFHPPGYAPARGAPISDPCTERLERFTGLGSNPLVIPEACTEVCDPTAPARPTDHFIRFMGESHNVEGGSPADALACIGPQGIDGCGYEAPLEVMLQALSPFACWNAPERPECEDSGYETPFLREDAVLAIAIITDEADCSVSDYAIMNPSVFWEVPPGGGAAAASSALCWNAGVSCSEPDADGVHAECVASNHDINGAQGVPDDRAVLHPLSRYRNLLLEFRSRGKEVMMLGILGVPEVTAHAELPPHQPTAGGVFDIEYRLWRDPQLPDGDILPLEWDAGITAADKAFEFGIGPGCIGYDEATDLYTGQAIPPVRIRELCESLDESDRIRCCIESICGRDFTPALRCLSGLIQDAIVPVE
jgi:hypothetical protein